MSLGKKNFENIVKVLQYMPSLDLDLAETGYENLDFTFDKPSINYNLDDLLRICIETKFPDCLDLKVATTLEHVLRSPSEEHIVGSCKLSYEDQTFEAFIAVEGKHTGTLFFPKNISVSIEKPFQDSMRFYTVVEVPEHSELTPELTW